MQRPNKIQLGSEVFLVLLRHFLDITMPVVLPHARCEDTIPADKAPTGLAVKSERLGSVYLTVSDCERVRPLLSSL